MIQVKLYDRDLSSSEFVDDLTEKIQGLRFTTKLNGGFYECGFRLALDLPAAWTWITKRIFYRLLIIDGPQTLWEGRLEDIALTEGGVTVKCFGFYANLSDIPYTTAYNEIADVILKAVLTANCAQINADQSNIDATGGPAITSGAGVSYLDIYPKQIVEKVLAFSDDTNNAKWYFAIWEDRKPYLFARDISTLNWRVDLKDFARFLLRHRGAELWNSAYAVYDAAGLVRTGTTTNAASVAKYGLTRRKVIPNLGTVVAGAAQSYRDGWVEDHKDVFPRLENMVLGLTVFNANGVPRPSSWVRAGDVLRVRDLVPVTADVDTITRDALRTYFLVKTEYDHDAGTMRITPDTEPSGLAEILGKKLKDGG